MKEITQSLPDSLAGTLAGSSAKKINRKKFFIYAGAAAAGVYSLTKLPFEIFKSKVENHQAKAVTFKDPYISQKNNKHKV